MFFWRYLEDSINKYKEYYDNNIGKKASISALYAKTNDRFWQLETDCWVGSLIKNIALAVEKVKIVKIFLWLINLKTKLNFL